MSFTDADLDHLHALAVAAAERAGDHIQSRAGRHRKAQTKDSGGTSLASQLVTEVDLEAQQIILDGLAESIADFDLGLLTEELEDDASRHRAEAFWCIDPLDGTLPFIEGSPGYSVSISLVSRGGTPLIGVVRDPVNAVTFHAIAGRGAYRNHSPLPPSVPGSRTTLTWIMDRSLKSAEVAGAVARIAAAHGFTCGVHVIDHAGAALNACWVAENPPAIYFKLPKPERGGGSVWDFAASACILSEQGCPPSDIHGEPLDLNPPGSTFMNERGVAFASSENLRRAVTAALAG